MHIAKVACIALVAASITSCASLEHDYSNTPTAELCMQYMTLPSYNLWHQARAKELARRGESCGDPASVASVRSQTDRDYNGFIQSTLQTPPPPPGGYQQGTHAYNIGGRNYMCTTTGIVTRCN